MEYSFGNTLDFELQDSPLLTYFKLDLQSHVFHKIAENQNNDWIDEYLISEAANQNSLKSIVQGSGTPESKSCDANLQRQVEEIVVHKNTKNRSIFHNIHKNLITFIKKVRIIRMDLIRNPGGLRAYDLWRIFKASKDFSKKSLYMIFGATEGFNEQYLKKAAISTPDLKVILVKYPLSDLKIAQGLLRKKVMLAISQLQKENIAKMCKMNSFDDFYTYLQSFKEELQGDGLAIRIKKTRKQEIVEMRINQSEENF